MKLSDITATLREIQVSPVKTLGQNFLHDQNLACWIVKQARLTRDDFVLEIGPGLGALTNLIVDEAGHVLAIEKDTRLANFLRERSRNERLEVFNMDALDFDVRSLFMQPQAKVLGNLPYKFSSPLLLKYLEYPSPISLWLFMLQRELALRLSASPSTKDYGALTLMVQLHHKVEYLRTVPATVFVPQPTVDSALVRIVPRDPLDLPPRNDELFVKLVRFGFSQRRKQLQKLLRAAVPRWEHAAALLNFDPKARAEDLSLEQWIGLTNLAAPLSAGAAHTGEQERFPVVDQQDRILRYAYRSEVHANNLRHRAVHILVFDKGAVYLQLRSRSKDRYPLRWDSSAAGHVAAGEDYDQTAHRELKEELGINLPLEKVAKLPASERTGEEFISLYRGEIAGEIRPNHVEIETGAFFKPEIVDGWLRVRPGDFAPGFVECWKAYRAHRRA